MNNRKGFTLIELLVTITILGIITIIALPTINRAAVGNNDKKYETYRKSMAYSGKVYTDSYSDDMFGYRQKGCVIVPISKLIEKKLIDDIQIKNMSCKDDQYSYVIVNKFKGKYYFKSFIGCGTREGSNIKNIKLYPESRVGASLCDESSDINMTFTTKPVESHDKTKKNLPISVLLTSASGAKKNAVIKYAFATTRGDLSSVKSSWGTLDTSSFTGEATQLQKIIEGEIPTLRFKDIKLENLSGKFFLVLDINQLYDINSDSYLKLDSSNKYFWSSRTFDIDNSKPIINNFTVNTQASGYNSTKPKINLVATDNNNLSANSDLQMCLKVGSSSCSESDWKSYNSNKTMQIDSITSYGTAYSVNVKVRDAAKNVSDLSTVTYQVSPKVRLTYNSNGGSACSAKETIQGTPWGALCTPSKAHYTFGGWYYNGSVVNASTIAQNNITVTANWVPVNYTLTYASDRNGTGCQGGTVTRPYGSTWGPLCTPTKAYNNFTNWTSNHVVINSSTPVTGNINVYANWQYIQCAPGHVVRNQAAFPSDTAEGITVRAYYWNYSSRNCGGNSPARTYAFKEYGCICNIDAGNSKYCSLGDTKDVTSYTHPTGYAIIYYNNSTAGKKACKAEYKVNSHVHHICENGIFPSDSNAIHFHGYWFYSAGVGDFQGFNSGWFHTHGNVNDRVAGNASVNDACVKACVNAYG